MNIRQSFAVLSVFAALATVQPASATLLSGTITGTVTTTGGSVPGVTVGSLLSGSYTYNNSTTVNDILGPVNPFTAFSLVIGTNSHVFTLSDLQTGVPVVPGVAPNNSTVTANDLFFFFVGSTVATYFGGGFVGNQSISNFPPQSYFVTNSDPTLSFGFAFTASPGVLAVPEPEMAVLLLIGAAGIGVASRRRSR